MASTVNILLWGCEDSWALKKSDSYQESQIWTVGKGVSGETVKRSDDGPSVVSYAEAVKGKQYVIE